jgi:hypothetical protein
MVPNLRYLFVMKCRIGGVEKRRDLEDIRESGACNRDHLRDAGAGSGFRVLSGPPDPTEDPVWS